MRWLRYIFNFVWITAFLLFLLLGSGWLALQFPTVQTYIIEKTIDYYSPKLKNEIAIGRVNIKWFDAISLENVLINDLEGRPMIAIDRLDIDHDFWELIANKDTTNHPLHLDQATLYKPSVWLIKNPKTGDLNLDDFIANIEALTTSKTPTNPDQNTPFFIDKITVIDGVFKMDDPREPLMKGRTFDYNHFTLKNINADTKNLMVLGDTIAIDVKKLRTFDQHSGLTIKELDSELLYCKTKLELAHLFGRIGSSVIRNYLSLNFKQPSDMGDFNNKVVIKAHLDSTIIHAKDLGYFADYLFTLNETWKTHGDFEGTVQDFKFKNAQLSFGKSSRIKGDIAFRNVTNFSKSIMDFDLKNTRVDAADLHQYYPQKSFIELMQKFGEVDFTGKYHGTIDNFKVTNADFRSSTLGRIKGDIKMNLSGKLPEYEGNIETENFDLGKLIDDPTFKLTDLNGRVKGKGFSIKDMTLDVDSWVKRFAYNDYEYHNIHLKGNQQHHFFEGLVIVKDSNLIANLDGTFDFSGNKYKYYARGKIERANLLALNFTKDSLNIHTDLDVNLEGNTVDEITGQAKFYNSYASLNKRNLVVDTLLIDSDLNNGQRKLNIGSEYLNFGAKGHFQPTKAVSDLSQLFKEYKLYFFENEANRTAYYDKKRQKTPVKRYDIDYKINFKKMDKLLAFLYPDGYVSPNAKAEGTFTIDNTSIFSFNGEVDTLKIGTNAFYQSEIDLNTSKFTNSPEVLASVIINSEKQQFGKLVPTEKMAIEGAWEDGYISFTSSLRQQKSTNRAALNGKLRFVGDQMQVQFGKSKLKLLDEDWSLAANNLITIDGNNLTFSNVSLSSKNQSILLDGDVSTDSLQALRLETHNFSLTTLNPVLNTNVAGTLNGVIAIRDLYKNTIYESDLDVKNLKYNDFLMGDVLGKVAWDGIDKHLKVDAGLTNDNKKVLNLTGIYDPIKIGNELDLKAHFNQTDLSLIAPFARGLVSDLSGVVGGTVGIKGSFTNPVFNGAVDVKRGKLTFDYLRASFAFEDKIYFDDDNIRVKKLKLSDPEGNVAVLDGGVFYGGNNDYSLGFAGNLKNFKILNTAFKDNELFYGTAYATGKIDVFGPIDKLQITTNLTSNKGTKIMIPLDDAGSVSTEEFVHFVSSKPDTTSKIALNAKPIETSGMKMDFHFKITPDAECQIKIKGDIIKAVGAGDLDFKIDTKGAFTMVGLYEIQKGDYTFTLPNLINKNFKIQSGSKMIWTGDPYAAMLDVKASYTQNTSLSPILPTGTASSIRPDVLSRRYPVEIIIGMTDKILTPNISLDMKFKDYPSDFQLAISAVETSFKSDEQYLKRQVFSMLVLNQLVPENADFVAQSFNTGAALGSVSELLNNQVSKFASSLDENLEIGVSGFDFTRLNSTNSNIWNDLQLRLSYRFLNDRFRITRDGRLSYGQGQADATATNLLSDWTLEYWITPDGNQRLKMYSRNTQNQFSLNTATVSYGASFTFSRSFNNFRIFGPKPIPQSTETKAEPKQITSIDVEN